MLLLSITSTHTHLLGHMHGSPRLLNAHPAHSPPFFCNSATYVTPSCSAFCPGSKNISFTFFHTNKFFNICSITLTVQPFPHIRYICVSDTTHSYHSGTVCKRAHSVGVNRLNSLPFCKASVIPMDFPSARPPFTTDSY